jgi:pentose-5-phosphate-3-epimerase
VITVRQAFYSQSALPLTSKKAVLDGRVIKINPALITLTDGKIKSIDPSDLQAWVYQQVKKLLQSKIFSVHVDVNYPDYRGYPIDKPDINTDAFSPAFVGTLNDLLRSQGKFLNLHLLTDHPLKRLQEYDQLQLGAVCFQLEVISNVQQLENLVNYINRRGACASPVIETVGSGNMIPKPINEVMGLLTPTLPKIGMLTFQGAGTASRSSQTAGMFARDVVGEYIETAQKTFRGTIQLQGGVTTATVGDAVLLGAEFLVCGTEIFHHPDGVSPSEVIDQMLQNASIALSAKEHSEDHDQL